VSEAIKLISDEKRLQELSENAKKLAEPEATMKIVDELEKLLSEK
jgi:UDP-N-acetylglucosamine:LPS N-acetylglucosamine transferase